MRLRNGMGDPDIRVTLKEVYDELSESYSRCVVMLAKQKKDLGNQVDAELCERRLKELEALHSEIFVRPAMQL